MISDKDYMDGAIDIIADKLAGEITGLKKKNNTLERNSWPH